MLAFCVVAIALPLTVGLFLNRINATPVVNIPPPPKAPKPNGFDLYVAAATATVRAKPEVDPASDTAVLTDPKVRAQRYGLARKTAWINANKKAFTLFDQALQTPVLAPTSRSFSGVNFGSYAKLRQLARAKTAQSNALWMRRDYNGALRVNLDTVQMGHDIRRGSGLIPTLVGIAVAAIGRANTGDTIERLNAAQCKSAARRMEKLLANRWRLDESLTEEKWSSQAGLMEVFGRSDWRKEFFGGEIPPLALPRVYTVSKQQIIDNVGASYDRQIANARLPFTNKGTPSVQSSDPFTDIMLIDDDRARINEARGLMGDNTLMLQLALRAYKLENGVYPPALKSLVPNYLSAVPADPFGGGESLRYKLNGVTYKLWSIGPDGKDDLGKPIPPRAGRKPPQNFAGERPRGPRSFVEFEGKGDVVAGINTG